MTEIPLANFQHVLLPHQESNKNVKYKKVFQQLDIILETNCPFVYILISNMLMKFPNKIPHKNQFKNKPIPFLFS